MCIYAKFGNKKYRVPKILEFVHVYFICTKIIKNSTCFLHYVPKWFIIGT